MRASRSACRLPAAASTISASCGWHAGSRRPGAHKGHGRSRQNDRGAGWPVVALAMVRPFLIAALLAAGPALAQPVAAPDCTVDGALDDNGGLRLEIVYRCRSSATLSFVPADDRTGRYVSDLKVGQANGLVQAHYRFDLSGYARAVDSTSVA